MPEIDFQVWQQSDSCQILDPIFLFLSKQNKI